MPLRLLHSALAPFALRFALPFGALLGALTAGCEPSAAPAFRAEAAALVPAPETASEAEPAPGAAAPAPWPDLPDGFVYLREIAPSIVQEMRYATPYNFVGERIDGYEAAECVLTEEAAAALSRVQEGLAREGLGLKVYDCYRPQRAVDHFVEWIRQVDRPDDDQRMKRAFYPSVEKRRLFREGYIARRSGHSRGSTLDLTVVRLPHAPRTAFPDPDDGPLPDCEAPRPQRLDEGDLDMGTAYDCLSPLAATDNPAMPTEVRANRRLLREAMSRGGFRNYPKEWWHFTLRGEPHPRTHFDFPIE